MNFMNSNFLDIYEMQYNKLKKEKDHRYYKRFHNCQMQCWKMIELGHNNPTAIIDNVDNS